MNILITGGAGYIGSHVLELLLDGGHNIHILDNLSTGRRESVLGGTLHQKELSDLEFIEELITKEKIDSVLHFAGSIVVPESVENPLLYYGNNTVNTAQLLQLCVRLRVRNFIFSSTAAVYGDPENGQCSEKSSVDPINPYGRTKLMTEWMLEDVNRAHPELNYVVLRYFNVAGASPSGRIGQCGKDSTHLIKLAVKTALGQRSELNVFGTNYSTNDGTCIRDYIHVTDLAQAHVDALNYLQAGGKSQLLNCGYGLGASVKEVIEVVKKVSGVDFKVVDSQRRAGDPAKLVAVASEIRKVLNWTPKYDNLEIIVKNALDWERTLSEQV